MVRSVSRRTLNIQTAARQNVIQFTLDTLDLHQKILDCTEARTEAGRQMRDVLALVSVGLRDRAWHATLARDQESQLRRSATLTVKLGQK